jgi:hypothetical protein
MNPKCPVCKQKLTTVYDCLDSYDGYKCLQGCYEFSDSKGINGGFSIRIGEKTMNDLYSGTVRQCRMQNLVTDRWIKKARKKLSK